MSKLALIQPAISLPKNAQDEFRVKVGLRNNRLVSLREKMELNQREAARKIGIRHATLNGFECLRVSPLSKDGVFSPQAQRVADFYQVKTGWIFPEVIEKIVQRDIEFTRAAEEMPDIFYQQSLLIEQSTPEQTLATKEMYERLHSILSSLSPRQERMLRMYFFEGMNFTEIAKEFSITSSRVGAIFATTLRLLRHPSRANRISGVDCLPLFKKENKAL